MKMFHVIPRINVALSRAKVAVKSKQKGLTTVEYAVAGSLVALAVVTAFSDLGNAVGDAINNLTNVIG